jgi:pyruvate formate lyase activating enzyme
MGERVLVTNIQRFAVNDGPGFRTNVFLKGCPLRCRWCHNPETIASHPELYWKRRLCVQCGACMEACPRDAINAPIPPEECQLEDSTYVKVIRDRCDLCMRCVEACQHDALEIVGKPMTIREILDEVESDAPFYNNSGGGMTLSGGEPTLHAEFASDLLEEARARGLHNCLDTSGHCSWEVLQRLLKNTDIVLYDLKHIDPEMHKRGTGVSNELILRNLALLVGSGMETWVRIPIIPDFNDTMSFHKAAAEMLAGLPGSVARVDLLPFHNYCQNKYGWLGLEWEFREVESVDPCMVQIFTECYREMGLHVTIGGSGFETSVEENARR